MPGSLGRKQKGPPESRRRDGQCRRENSWCSDRYLQGRFIHLQRNEDGELEYANPSDETKRETLGFVKNGRILVEPTAWRTELCAGFDPEKTARHLRDEGLLATDPGKLQRQHKILRGGLVEKGRFYDLDMKILEDMAGTGPDEKGA